MKRKILLSRRDMLRTTLGAAPLLIVPLALRGQGGGYCATTPRQSEGPFYPVRLDVEQDSDLTRLAEGGARAKGDPILVTGRVIGAGCRPIRGAVVEIWQACWSGRYNHPRDGNPAPLDPNFQYWGVARTDGAGRYAFRTVVPGPYPASPSWMRPPHIHFKIRGAGSELVTQMYFAGERYNATDRLLLAVPEAERSRVVIAPQPPPAGGDPNARMFRFDIFLT